MGIATVLIILCHAPANGVVMPHLLDRAMRWGGVGVDMFLFYSGLGMYYSLQKTTNIKEWYKRRYMRVLVPFFMFAIPYYIFRMIIDEDSMLHFVGNITTISFWTRHEGAWFVALLILLYLFTPLNAKIIDGARIRWMPVLVFCLLSIVGACLPTTNAVLNNIQMCLAHVPSFLVGYWVALYVSGGMEIKWSWVALSLVVYVVLLFFYRQLNVSSNWMIVLPGSIVLAGILNKWPVTAINSSLLFLGTISLESYLANIFLPVVLRKTGAMSFLQTFDNGNYVFYMFVVLAGVSIAYVGHVISGKMLNSALDNNRK